MPLAPNWGRNHRGVALRVPLSALEDTRVEHRPGGADGNPYLVLAAILAGIHHGIANKIDPGPMVEPGTVIDEKIGTAACAGKRRSTRSMRARVLPKYLGERYHKLYATCRREECDRFHAEIPDRDYEWYLRAV